MLSVSSREHSELSLRRSDDSAAPTLLRVKLQSFLSLFTLSLLPFLFCAVNEQSGSIQRTKHTNLTAPVCVGRCFSPLMLNFMTCFSDRHRIDHGKHHLGCVCFSLLDKVAANINVADVRLTKLCLDYKQILGSVQGKMMFKLS